MINIKTWGVGDLVKEKVSLPIDGTFVYNHIEALEGKDIDNHISIRRSIRNLVDNDEYLQILFKSFGEIIYSNISGVLDNFLRSLNFTSTDVIYVDGKAFVRIKPGLIKLDDELIIIKPNTSIAERELEKALRLDLRLPDPEGVKIYYDLDTDTYHAKIRKINGLVGEIIEYEFINTDTTFLDFQGGGYNSSVELMNDIKQHPVFSVDFIVRILNLNSIQLEPSFELPLASYVFRYIGFNSNYDLVVSETTPYYYLWQFQANTLDSLQPSSIIDNRSYLNPATSDGIPNTLVLRDGAGGLTFNNLHVLEEIRIDGENFNVNEFGDVSTKRDVYVGGDAIVEGGILVKGTLTTVNTETVSIANNLIEINGGLEGPPPAGLIGGIEVKRGTLDSYFFIFDEDSTSFKIGITGSLQKVATRQDAPINKGVAFWNNAEKRFDTNTNFTFSSTYNTLTVTNITGSLSGNASSATILETARTINGTSFNGSQNITTANWGTSRNISIGGTSKAVNGSANVTWTEAEIAANTAVTLKTARNINGTSFNGSTDITTANWGTSRNLTIGLSGKAVNGSTAVTWTLTEIGAEPIIAVGTTAQYWRGDKTWQTLNTSNVPEETNLYFTTARARTSLAASAPIVYTSATGVISHTDSSTVRHVTDAEKSNWNNAYSHISSDGSSHTFIDQSVTVTATPTFNGLTINGPIIMGNYRIIYNSETDTLDTEYIG